jgi:hypothetical protein
VEQNLQLSIDPNDQRTFGPCECCGNMTHRVWGYVYDNDAAIAAYFVEWTPGHIEQAANFDLIVGRWGDETSASDRVAIALEYRCLDSGPAFMVVNADTRPVARNANVGKALTREQVIGTELAPTAFAICDEIFLHDGRLITLPGCED